MYIIKEVMQQKYGEIEHTCFTNINFYIIRCKPGVLFYLKFYL